MPLGRGLGCSTADHPGCGDRVVGLGDDEDIVRAARESARRVGSAAELAVAAGRDLVDERFHGVAEFRRLPRQAGRRPRRRSGYRDIPAAPQVSIERLLPYGGWRVPQNRRACAAGMGPADASWTG
jgi:hypothetical protein